MNVRKILLVAFIIAAVMLLSVPGADVSASLMANDGCDIIPVHPISSPATCCELGECIAVCCSVPEIPGDKSVVTNLPVPVKNFIFAFYKTIESVVRTFTFDKPPKQDVSQLLYFHLYSEYHCRNNLNSEESFHI